MVDNMQKKLNELISLYSKSLPDKIHKIILHWKGLEEHWDLEAFRDFHREVHSLCGSAGTYGYTELSKEARKVEVILKEIVAKGQMDQEEAKLITSSLNALLAVFNREQLKSEIIPESLPSPEIENKSIYILEQDHALFQQLSKGFKHVGFTLYLIQDLITLQVAVKEKIPVALIIDSYYLDKQGIQLLAQIQREQPDPIQLFCILPNEDIAPRLSAVRAGCQAFFQKPIDTSQLVHLVHQKCGVFSDDPIRVLIIDDSKALAEYYSLILNQAGMNAKAITNPLLLLNELESFQPNLLLMDVYMPECTGFELGAILRHEARYTKIPIIFLSTEEDKEKKLFAISLGGDDFLTKPVSHQHLISAVRSRAKRASILNYYMSTDSLTGLSNHSSILTQLDLQLKRAYEAHLSLAFVMVDIDHFKKINDSYGHLIGDKVIQKLADLFLTRLYSKDNLGRYGGEEFALILPGAKLDDAINTINALRIRFSQHRFEVDNTHFFATFSAGIACFDGCNTSAELIEIADRALYEAKLLGRNQVFFKPLL